MYFSYNNVWKLLIDKKMNKQDLKKKPESVRRLLQNLAKARILPRMFNYAFIRLWIAILPTLWKL